MRYRGRGCTIGDRTANQAAGAGEEAEIPEKVRIGILGTAAAAVYALIDPARALAHLEVASVASRSIDRARAYGQLHGIPGSTDYEGLLGDPSLDAIYIALPNALHVEWSLRALRAGKAVLCEKPLACNAAEARFAVASADSHPPLVEAFHWRHHPIASRLKRLAREREFGAVRHVEVQFCYPPENLQPGDIRLDYARGGGVMLDAGSYCVNLLRLLLGEPIGVQRAQARLWSPQVDGEMQATLEFADGAIGSLVTRNDVTGEFAIGCVIHCERGVVTVHNPFLPSFFESRMDFESEGRRWSEPVDPTSTYHYQAQNFAEVVRGRAVSATPAADAIGNLTAIDLIYRAAGLLPRGDPEAAFI